MEEKVCSNTFQFFEYQTKIQILFLDKENDRDSRRFMIKNIQNKVLEMKTLQFHTTYSVMLSMPLKHLFQGVNWLKFLF